MSEEGIACPGCGRRYAQNLFGLGRTIDCTCGARVGLEPAPREQPEEPRFVADGMLGRLARRLRLLGFDVAWEPGILAEEVARRAWEESRVALTRSTSLPRRWRLPHVVVLRSTQLSGQLRELEGELAIRGGRRPFTRCSRCNEPLDEVTPESVAQEVPPRVLREQSQFARCPRCGRVYWHGSHVARMRQWMDEAQGGGSRAGEGLP
jgi:uncharacterized protein with PIN domain